MTGARRGELLGLTWQDVDLDAGMLRIRQAANWLPGRGFVLSQPKTHRSRRPIALAAPTVDVLKEHRRRQVEQRLAFGGWPDHDLVFTNETGGPLDPANLRRAWLDVVRTAGVGHVRLHDLRHACATLMLTQGVHPRVVAERLGHADTATTMNIYSHVLPHLQEEAAIGLERLLSNG